MDAARGVKREVPFQVAAVCGRCSGDGAEPGSAVVPCPTCGGAGRLQQVSRSVFGEFVRTQTCSTCAGSGRRIEKPCTACNGAGRVLEERRFEVEIPAGIHDGQRIRLSGEGHAGLPGGRAGDLYVHVHVKPDPRFVREGDDVFSTVDLTMTQAALGAKVAVRRSTATRSSTSPPARSRARSSSCAAAACRCCKGSAAATTACSSTSSCRAT